MPSTLNYGGKHFERRKLEKLFGSGFSRLSIDDEYKYNLSYLLKSSSQDLQTTIPPERSKNVYRSQNTTFYSAKSTNFLDRLKRENSLTLHDEIPEKQTAEKRMSLKPYPHNAHLPHTQRPVIPQPKLVMDTRKNSAPCELNRIHPYSIKKLKTNDRKMSEEIANDLKAKVSLLQHSKPLYSGLHIYVSEASSKESLAYPSNYFSSDKTKKSVACDPIIIMHQPKLQRMDTDMSHEYSVDEDDTQAINAKRTFETCKTSTVASRIEALMALINPKARSQDNEMYQQPPPIYKEREITIHMPDERQDIKRQPARLQRSSTIATVREARSAEYCFSCCKRIYPMDRISIEERVYHKACFKCATCHRTLLPGTFACLDGIILCKPHYIEQFRRCGRYELRASFMKMEESQHSDESTQTSDE